MGSGRWSVSDWEAYSAKNIRSKASVDAIYASRNLVPELDPKGIKFRESCDSADNPLASPLIVALDVTGSMGIGDAEAGDRAPLQVTQFEADIRIAEQLTKIYLERGGLIRF